MVLHYDVPGQPDARLTVAGDRIILLRRLPLMERYGAVREHTATYHMDTPFFTGLEEFCDYAGDGLRVGVVQLEMGDRIIYLYDHRPAFHPLIGDVVSESKRKRLRREQRNEPELFGPNDEMLEHQQAGNFGYGWNLDVDYNSEWGFAPFPQPGETVEEMNSRITEGINNFLSIMGADDSDHGTFVIDVGAGVVSASYED